MRERLERATAAEAELAGPDQAQWYERLEHELDNLRRRSTGYSVPAAADARFVPSPRSSASGVHMRTSARRDAGSPWPCRSHMTCRPTCERRA